MIKSALLDSLIQSKYGQKTVGAFSASDTVHYDDGRFILLSC